jgi:hypothetical protein
MTRLSYSNHPNSNLWGIRVWSCSLCSILYYVLSLVLELLRITKCLHKYTGRTTSISDNWGCILQSSGAWHCVTCQGFPTFYLGRPETEGKHYHSSRSWEIPNDTALTSRKLPHHHDRCESLISRPLRICHVNTQILKTGFERLLSGSG